MQSIFCKEMRGFLAENYLCPVFCANLMTNRNEGDVIIRGANLLICTKTQKIGCSYLFLKTGGFYTNATNKSNKQAIF